MKNMLYARWIQLLFKLDLAGHINLWNPIRTVLIKNPEYARYFNHPPINSEEDIFDVCGGYANLIELNSWWSMDLYNIKAKAKEIFQNVINCRTNI